MDDQFHLPHFTCSWTKHERTLTEKIEKFISTEYFTDVNLRGRLFSEERNLPDEILHFDAGQNRPDFEEAKENLEVNGKPVNLGLSFGPTWATHWFRVDFSVPENFSSPVFIWDSGCEALVWSPDGEPIQGLSSDFGRIEFALDSSQVKPNVKQRIFIEAACNGLFGAGKDGQMIQAPDPNKTFKLSRAEIVSKNEAVFQLLMDFEILLGMIENLPKENHHRYEALYFGNWLIDHLDVSDPKNLQDAHKKCLHFLEQKNGDNQFLIHAISNCHIDSAWLWKYAETKRKCARSWSSTIRLMDQYPDFFFVGSQMQQFAWVKEDYPKLYEKIKRKIAEKRFIPVGGAWVEMDGNLPSGESFCRQILYGQKFMKEEFGFYATEFWLPDTFGYSPQLPQIMRLGGMNRFLTQKISWNLVNKFPHHTFFWVGLDGSEVLTHFPSGDSYALRCTVKDVIHTANNFQDKGRTHGAILLYGHGDGGGGPTAEMIERQIRMKNRNSLPVVKSSTPDEFFAQIERRDQSNLCKWRGELYLELHNGTYTTQAEIKKFNRFCEFLLRTVEFVSALKWIQSSGKDWRSWEDEWKLVLLNQFHDVLPGSSIHEVYTDAKVLYHQVIQACNEFFNETDGQKALVNPLPWDRQIFVDGKFYSMPGMSIVAADSEAEIPQSPKSENSCSITNLDGEKIEMKNRFLTAIVDRYGRIESLKVHRDAEESREVVVPGRCANQFTIFDDVPLYWDAWDIMDYHLDTRRVIVETMEHPQSIQLPWGAVQVKFVLKISMKSQIQQLIILEPHLPYLKFETTVEWFESHKFLKVEFPVNVLTNEAKYECQYGHLSRPTHENSSWDSAKFEVCAQKWATVEEFGFGMALLNDSKYGYSCRGSTLSLSLLRAPKAPDPFADLGRHKFTYAVFPYFGSLQNSEHCQKSVIQVGYELNLPMEFVKLKLKEGFVQNFSLVKVDVKNVLIDCLKISENGRGIILRFYEAFGGRCKCSIQFHKSLRVQKVSICDILERKLQELQIENSDGISTCVNFTPFQVITLYAEFPFNN